MFTKSEEIMSRRTDELTWFLERLGIIDEKTEYKMWREMKVYWGEAC